MPSQTALEFLSLMSEVLSVWGIYHAKSKFPEIMDGASLVAAAIGTSLCCLFSPCLVLSEDLVQKKKHKPTV